MKLKPFTRGVLRLWVVLTVVLFVYSYFKGVESRQAWPRTWLMDTVLPAKLAVSNPACQPVILNPERTGLIDDEGCKSLRIVLTTSEKLKALTAAGVKITSQDIQAEYDDQYSWYGVKGGLLDAGVSVASSAFFLGIFCLLIKTGRWVFAGFRKETV